ncbi:MerR family transcriptional regulator [Paenibacillus glucanolyticus]|jgi:DNA-binding transcriptional MerR regulator|uniref:MerR family transcriptional regulator n=1 Tax=Paenibacillus TaxID=44249 RepID=UPI0003E2A0E7|nr:MULTISPECIES: MerR family transcriptional regulator [Paenibacillus]ANA79737.1 transcriptional regulator [Paenibacillus glucanolyticus]AVV56241.1 MerR family transcriptional regulator [Paenibacillus glucanolyticus]ETT38935.1 transcriptional regulator [Paenibacillus sp. FSL R5-808]MPY20119.1 MerR family transcriptional regulator [Paenibacillus glucanolyticus]
MNRWTTGQVAKQWNISVRTLRYYDQIGLLKPSEKEDNGRRYYSEDDLFTLEKITLLKSLALPLEEIQNVLDKLSYRDILTAHHNHLQEQLSLLQTHISNTTSLIHMIDLEGSLSWERVSHLVQNAQASAKKWTDYFEEEERAFLQQALPNLSHNDRMTQQYVSLLRRIEWCVQQAILPESDEGYNIASELMALSNETFGGDEDLMDKFWEMRKRPAEESGLYPVSEEVLEFVERSIAYVEERNNIKELR